MSKHLQQMINQMYKNGPKCHGMHPAVVGYVCPHCGHGKGAAQRLKLQKQPRVFPPLQPVRVIGTPSKINLPKQIPT